MHFTANKYHLNARLIRSTTILSYLKYSLESEAVNPPLLGNKKTSFAKTFYSVF